MKITIVELVILLFFAVNIDGEGGACMLLADVENDVSLDESVCYLSCLSSALSKLYTDGERKMFVNEEVYAKASRILDYMEWKSGESTKYLSVIGGVMEGKDDKLEKLISYGSAMGDLVAKVGGLFAEVNESVRAVREKLPDALIKANKYYTAISEITRTVWDDVKALLLNANSKCENAELKGVEEFKVMCGKHVCPLRDNVIYGALQKYKNGCLAITVQNGSVSERFNGPRENLYRNGALKNSSDVSEWKGVQDGDIYFQIKLRVQEILSFFIDSFAAGQAPSALLDTMFSITSLCSRLNEIHINFNSLFLQNSLTNTVNSSSSSFKKNCCTHFLPCPLTRPHTCLCTCVVALIFPIIFLFYACSRKTRQLRDGSVIKIIYRILAFMFPTT